MVTAPSQMKGHLNCAPDYQRQTAPEEQPGCVQMKGHLNCAPDYR
jgi:hypothetical protein